MSKMAQTKKLNVNKKTGLHYQPNKNKDQLNINHTTWTSRFKSHWDGVRGDKDKGFARGEPSY